MLWEMIKRGQMKTSKQMNLYRDVDVNMVGRDTKMTDAPRTIIQTTQTNQYAEAVSLIPDIVDTFLANKINEAVKTAVQLQSDKLRDEAQAKNEDFIKKHDENIKKIIKEQVKEQVKAQVSKILSKIKKTVNEQLEIEVLIHKMERNKSIHKSDEQKNLYKALVDAYESDKLILDTYGDTVMIEIRRDDQDEDEETFAGSNRGQREEGLEKNPSLLVRQRRRLPKQPVNEITPHPDWFKKPSKPATPDRDWNKTLPTQHGTVQPWISNLARKDNSRDSFNELMDTSLDFLAFLMNQLKVDTLTLKLLAGQQHPHDLHKPLPLIPNSRGRQVIPFEHFINNDLAYLSGGVSSRIYTTSVTKTKAADYGHIKESARDVYSKRRIIAVTELQIVEWHNYKHLDWITIRRDDDKLYKLKEGNFKRLRIQDIEDMLLLLVQGKLTNLSVEERLAFNVSFPRGFIYLNEDKKNRLMHIDELLKFSDGTLNDVRTALDDRLKGIWMKYVPQTIWRQSDRDKQEL
nr:hypothetical protein [Tanacetum cinerariifolium]